MSAPPDALIAAAPLPIELGLGSDKRVHTDIPNTRTKEHAMHQVTLKRQSTDEANVCLRDVWYDIYVDGQYLTSRNDICDALDLKAQLEQSGTTEEPSE